MPSACHSDSRESCSQDVATGRGWCETCHDCPVPTHPGIVGRLFKRISAYYCLLSASWTEVALILCMTCGTYVLVVDEWCHFVGLNLPLTKTIVFLFKYLFLLHNVGKGNKNILEMYHQLLFFLNFFVISRLSYIFVA